VEDRKSGVPPDRRGVACYSPGRPVPSTCSLPDAKEGRYPKLWWRGYLKWRDGLGMGCCRRLSALLMVVILPVAGPILAQTPPSATPPAQTSPAGEASPEKASLTAETIAARRRQLESADLSEETKAQAEKLYDQALQQLKQAEQHAQAADHWKELQQSAPQEVDKLKAELAAPPEPVELDVPPDSTLADLDQLVMEAGQQLADAENKVSDLQREPVRRADRRAAVAQETQDAQKRLADSEAALAAPPDPAVPEQLALARQTLDEATRLASTRQLEALAAELPAYDATAELIELQLAAAQREVERRQQAVQELSDLATERRREQAQQQERQARIAAARALPLLQPLAEENLRLTQLRTGPEGLAAKIEQATDQLKQARDAVARLDEVQLELEEKLRLPGMATYAGPLLLQTRSDLPRSSDLQRKIYLRNQEIAAARFEMADARRRRARLENPADEIKSLLKQYDAQPESVSKQEIAAAAEQLLTTRQNLLEDLETDYTTYFNLLIELNTQQQQLLNKSQQIRSLVDDHLMWVRASGVFGWSNLTACLDALLWLVDVDNWRQLGLDALASLSTRPWVVIVLLLVFLVLLLFQRRMKRTLHALGERAASSYLVPFRTTLEAFGLTLLLTLTWPSLIFALGGCLYWSLAAADFTRGVGAGLLACGVVLVAIEFTRRLLAGNGLAEAHFRWTDRRISLVQWNLGWLAACMLPLIVVIGLIQWEATPQRQDSLGRLLFVVVMLLVAVFMQRILRPLPPAAEDAAVQRRPLTRRLIYGAAILLPLLVAGLSLAGFHFTAWQLALRLFQTACLALGMLVLQGLAVRWLRLVRGSLALQQARQRREARRQAAQAESPEEMETEIEPEVDLQTVNLQTRQMLHLSVAATVLVGLWLIWLDVLPFGQWFDQPLWPATAQASSAAAASKGEAPSAAGGMPVVTRAHLLLAVLVAITTLLASRNIPGLIEVSLPQNTPLDAGARYALSTVIRYLLIALGVVAASSLIGISWSNVQWLVAALSVGVGFGLQELVANFISGLILLFERPVRVGDIITIDDVTGTVTRVQIRATTIRNWDRQEYIVPNKDLITGRVLSNDVNRITINVGVAYASNARRVRELLFEIARAEPNVLDDPEPLVTFEEFGDSALTFLVRAYIANLDNRLETITQLHTRIHQRFAEEGIEIAFPQRDINIRSLPDGQQGDGQADPLLGTVTHTRGDESAT
jgi:potassium efflux system protein